MPTRDILPKTVRAHELYGDFWFNSEPVLISALRGQVVLIEFWDYTCVSCHRSLPYVSEWNRKYQKYGFVVVGVHTPKFPFGKNPDIVQKAIERLGVVFPVVMDNEQLIAAHYDARVWPTFYLIDKNGFVRHKSEGEGAYTVTEHAIQTLLYDAGVGEELPLLMEPVRDEDKPGAVCYRATPELFAGYLRGSIGNVEGFSPESVMEYHDPRVYLDGRFYADGNWLNDKDSLRLVGGRGGTGHIILSYHALEVNAVLKPEAEKDLKVTVSQDQQYLNVENMGNDVQLSPDGKSFLVVEGPRLYNIVRNKEYGEHTLRLSTESDGFAVYSFTFVSSIIPELISNN